MAEKLALEVNIDGFPVLKSVRKMTITQQVFAHHRFEIMVPAETIDSDYGALFDSVSGMIGKDIAIDWSPATFASTESESSTFKGLVTDVSVVGERATHLMVVIKGTSPTVLLDGVKHTNSFSEVGLSDIFSAATGSNLNSRLAIADNVGYSGTLPFTVQYNETDFHFMSRMFQHYGEWFFYDGEQLSLGLGGGSVIDVTKDRVMSLDFSFNISSPRAKLHSRDYLASEVVDLTPAAPSQSDSLADTVSGETTNLYPANSDHHIVRPSFAEGEPDQVSKQSLQEIIDLAEQGRSNNSLEVRCVSNIASIQPGRKVKLEGFAHGGEFIVIEVTHTSLGTNGYENHFVAIPQDVSIPAIFRTPKPKMGESMAIVVDNQDPEKMGRVKVKFDWGEAISPWLRMVVPHTGAGKGFYFVPELDEEVMVGFEMNDPDSPYVIGSLYSGTAKFDTHFEGENKVKSIRTISGNEIIFDDNGTMTVHNDKNRIILKCAEDGVLDIITDGDMNLTSAKNMSITVGEEFTMTVGKNYDLAVAENISMAADMEIGVTSGTAMSAEAGTECSISATTSMDIAGGTATSVTGLTTVVEGSTTADVKSSGITQVQGSMVKIN